jgi:hypothetical protein
VVLSKTVSGPSGSLATGWRSGGLDGKKGDEIVNEVKFSPNIPQTLALASSEGELDDRYNRVHYTLVDGRGMVLSSLVAAKLNGLELRQGETFGICKRWTGEQSEPVSWTVWLTPQTEQQRATEEITASERGEQSLEPVRSPVRRLPRRQTASQPDPGCVELAPTGTDGPAPRLAPALRPVKAAGVPLPCRLPYNIAFREVVQFVTAGLKETGEQWNDEARQGPVSTVLISAAKAGLLCLWERPGGSL